MRPTRIAAGMLAVALSATVTAAATLVLSAATATAATPARPTSAQWTPVPPTGSPTTPAPVDTQPPSAPGQVRATGITETGLTLSWAPATDNVGVVHYQIWASREDYIYRLATVTTPGYVVTGLRRQSQFGFRVEAVDAAGNTSVGGYVSGWTAPGPYGIMKAQTRDLDDPAAGNGVRFGLRLHNQWHTNVWRSSVQVRYWFTRDGSAADGITVACAAAGRTSCDLVTTRVVAVDAPRRGADAYVEIGFRHQLSDFPYGGFPSGTTMGDLEFTLTRADGRRLREGNDHSAARSADSYVDHPRITIHYLAQVVWGVEPPLRRAT